MGGGPDAPVGQSEKNRIIYTGVEGLREEWNSEKVID
jgi:hypothetical protein